MLIMYESINEKVSVILSYNREAGTILPLKMRWQGRVYSISKLSYHHKIRDGRTILHIFHVTNGALDFRLKLNTDTLHWTLEEISDGTPD